MLNVRQNHELGVANPPSRAEEETGEDTVKNRKFELHGMVSAGNAIKKHGNAVQEVAPCEKHMAGDYLETHVGHCGVLAPATVGELAGDSSGFLVATDLPKVGQAVVPGQDSPGIDPSEQEKNLALARS